MKFAIIERARRARVECVRGGRFQFPWQIVAWRRLSRFLAGASEKSATGRFPLGVAFAWGPVAAVIFVGQSALPARADPVSNGKSAFSLCSTCHTVSGAEDSGPHLNGLLGRKAGSVSRFNYSSAMKNADIVWDAQTLDQFLANPQLEVPGNRMRFPGVADAAKRADIIAYLASFR
jgi:cytochrome c